MKLLSDDEVARVSTAQTASHIPDGDEYVNLEQLDKGVQRALRFATTVPMGDVLGLLADRPRDAGAVRERITAYLAGVQERVQAAERERAVAVAKAVEERRRRNS